jgi:hypothetical protein
VQGVRHTQAVVAVADVLKYVGRASTIGEGEEGRFLGLEKDGIDLDLDKTVFINVLVYIQWAYLFGGD